MMNRREQSDSSVLPRKSSNKAGRPVAEGMEGRELAKRNSRQTVALRTQGRARVIRGLERIRQVAKRDKEVRFTALLHHVYDVDMLREAYFNLKRDAAPGVDGETWQHYGKDLEANLQDLSRRLKEGTYQATPVRRTYIPKADGRQRPLGVTSQEDKVVQRAVVAVLNAIYETEFLGFSYGFRPGRSQHNALDALDRALMTRKVEWVLDADLRGFFDSISHEWLVKFVEHRIGDRRIVRLIQQWLRAGVLEDGTWTQQEEGTPQGGSASPLLANLYLHYAFDQWVQQWRRKKALGEVIVVRWADDFIVGFERQSEAERFLGELKERLKKFGLELHSEKTRLLEFGRHAAERRKRRGLSKPETFNFLGLTHCCGKSRKGWFTLTRHTMRQRLRAKLKEVRAELRQRRHDPIPAVGAWLRSVIEGHFRYYGVSGNIQALKGFRYEVLRTWQWALKRRSQKAKATWERMTRLEKRWLPRARIYHPYPSLSTAVTTQGKSPVP
jgi:RNA-directed DNA polymerase